MFRELPTFVSFDLPTVNFALFPDLTVLVILVSAVPGRNHHPSVLPSSSSGSSVLVCCPCLGFPVPGDSVNLGSRPGLIALVILMVRGGGREGGPGPVLGSLC